MPYCKDCFNVHSCKHDADGFDTPDKHNCNDFQSQDSLRCEECGYYRDGIDKHGNDYARCNKKDMFLDPYLNESCHLWHKKKEKKKKEQKEKIDIKSPYFMDGEFVPKILGDILLNEHDILTVSDSRDSAIYQHGVYVLEGADDIIRKIILDKLELDFKRTHVNEVVEYIKLNTLTSREVINQETFKINVMNGMYDVKNNKLLPHSSEYLSTIQLPITYDPDAQCTQIHKFLHEVVDPDDVLVLVQYAGYCCIPDISHQKSLLLDGLAANGKSTFIDLVCTMVGQENVSEQSLQDLNNDKYSSAQLNGKLINMFSDLPRTKLGDNSAFKMLTSDKWIDGEEKYKRKFRFKNTIHQIYSANNIPEVDDPDELAFFRRWICITFPNSFIGRENKHLLSEITTDEELSGFFNISMVALRSLIDNDEFCYNKSVSDVQKIYLLKSDPVQSFLDDCTEVSDFNLPKKELYSAFCMWCEDNTILTTVKDNSFGRKMKKLGYESWRMTDTSRTHVWLNVGLISFPEQNNSYDFNDSCNLSRFGENQEKTWTRKKESTDSDKKSSCPGSQVNIPIVDIYARAYVRGKGFDTDNPDMGVKPTKTRNQAECPGSKNNLDITRTECTKDQRTRMKDVMDIILDIQSSTDNKANRSDIIAAAEDVGIHDTDIILKHMATEGRILQHSDDIFQVI